MRPTGTPLLTMAGPGVAEGTRVRMGEAAAGGAGVVEVEAVEVEAVMSVEAGGRSSPTRG